MNLTFFPTKPDFISQRPTFQPRPSKGEPAAAALLAQYQGRTALQNSGTESSGALGVAIEATTLLQDRARDTARLCRTRGSVVDCLNVRIATPRIHRFCFYWIDWKDILAFELIIGMSVQSCRRVVKDAASALLGLAAQLSCPPGLLGFAVLWFSGLTVYFDPQYE